MLQPPDLVLQLLVLTPHPGDRRIELLVLRAKPTNSVGVILSRKSGEEGVT